MKKTASRVQFWDKILPDQPLLCNLYRGSKSSLLPSMYRLVSRTCEIRGPDVDFQLTRSPKVSIEEMASNPVMLRFLEMIVLLRRPRRILEIGAFIGISAMSMARRMPADGRLITIEKFDHFAEIARLNIRRNRLAGRITVLEGDAHQVMRSLRNGRKFDLVFIDGNKERYADYLRMADLLVNRGGLILIDDIFFHGDALNAAPKTEKGKGARRALEAARKLKRYHRAILPVANGILLLLKK